MKTEWLINLQHWAHTTLHEDPQNKIPKAMSNNDPPNTRRGNPGARSYMKTIISSKNSRSSVFLVYLHVSKFFLAYNDMMVINDHIHICLSFG